MFDPDKLYTKAMEAAKDYADKDHAAGVLEDALDALKGDIIAKLKSKGEPVTIVGSLAKSDPDYKEMTKEYTDKCDTCDGTGDWWDEEYEEYVTCYDCDGEGEVTYTDRNYEGEDLGVLTDLYLDLPNRAENRFTDDWTKTFDIRIGQVVKMPMQECNWSTQDCAAAGLHFTADQIHYVGCGDQSVLMLINPMKVVGIGTAKGRCYEYLPISTVSREEATKILHDLDFSTLDLDEFYVENELESLSERAQAAFAEEAKKYNFNLPSISSFEIGKIVNSLNKMKDELSGRVKEVV